MKEYFENLNKEVVRAYEIAREARKKGLDPGNDVEIMLASKMAERVKGIVSTVSPQIGESKIVERIDELEKQYGAQDWRVAFILSLEVAKEKLCKFKDKREAAEVGLRVGLAYLTNGVLSSPLEGFVQLKLRNRKKDGKEYWALYFSGPIRSAGTTAVCVFIAVADYVRKELGYAEYDPTEQEVNRLVTELYDFHDRITNLQYLPAEEEIAFMVSNLPVQIDGDPSEKMEVSNYKDLDRIETNRLRNGVCLVVGEGLCQKAAKFYSKFANMMKDFGMERWKFLEDYVTLQKKLRSKDITKTDVKIKPDFNFMKDVVAGRPIFTHPMAKGGFRLRYGRSRVSGFSAMAIHPATMHILDGFLASGSQLKVERPGKACVVGSCDTIEGPIVKLKDGSVVFVETEAQAKKVNDYVDEILYLGDLLVNYGDFLNRGHILVPAGYCLPYNEKVFIYKDNLWQNIEIGKLIESLDKSNSRNYNSMSWYDIKEDIKVLSLNPDTYKIEETKVNKFIVKKTKESYLKIKLEGGKTINVSKDHPLMSISKEGFIKKKAIDIKEGEYLPCAKSLNIHNKISYLNIIEIFNSLNFDLSYFDINKSFFKLKGNRVYLPSRIKVDKYLSRILGFYAAEGSSTKKGKSPRVVFSFGKHEKSLVEELCRFIYQVFKVNPTLVCEKTSLKVYLYGKIFPILFEDIFCAGKDSYSKKVPKIIFNSNHDEISNYLDSYFLGDGSFDQNSANELTLEVTCQSSSNDLISDLHYLLLFLSINSNIYFSKKRNIHILRVQGGDNIIKFIKYCGSAINIRNLKHLASTIYKPSSEKYPHFFFDISKANDWQERSIIKNAINRNGRIGANISLECISEAFLKIKESQTHLLRIISIENVEYDGDFYNIELDNNHIFLHGNGVFTHNCEEWWQLEADYPERNVDVDTAIELCKKGKPLHPRYTFHWDDITREQFFSLIEWLKKSAITNEKIILPLNYNLKDDVENKDPKRTLEILGVPHRVVVNEHVIIEGEWAKILLFTLGDFNFEPNEKVLEMLNKKNSFLIRDKSGTFIGARMGRPEKAKIRKLKGSPQVLFPVGSQGGRMRDFRSALEKGFVKADFPVRKCEKCNQETIYKICETCSIETKQMYYCTECNVVKDKKCHERSFEYSNMKIDIHKYFNKALETIGIREYPELIKGVKGTMNESHLPENLVKGILRAMNGLYVNKDGTIRYDMTETPITHFKPKEIGTNVQKLKELGYEKDCYGADLISDEQICELKVQDLILPACPDSLEEGADEILFRIGKFVDDLMEKFYKLPRFYNFKNKKDIIGSLVLGLSPHTSAGIVGRIIGFSKTQGFLAHPTYHSIMRRDADGDEACVIMLMDALLNFSRGFLPAHRGGKQDEPLVLTTKIIPKEVDDMVFDMDIAWKYPLELYLAALEYKSPKEVKIDKLGMFLGTPREYEGYGFTHDTSDINNGVKCSTYKSIPTMIEKVQKQMRVAEKLRAVDEVDVAGLIIDRHFMRDIKGNLRKFSQQEFRCVECNEKYRRPPLQGNCVKCAGKLLFTVSEGNILKYLEPSLMLAEKYDLSPYLRQNLKITKARIESIFGRDLEKQEGLKKWF